MWFSLRLSRHLRLGIPWWMAIVVYPFVLVGITALVVLNVVVWLLAGILWLALWPFTRKPKRRAASPRGDGQIRVKIHIRED
jgi:hypothetical protein